MIWIESVIEKHSHSRIEYMVKVGESGHLGSLSQVWAVPGKVRVFGG